MKLLLGILLWLPALAHASGDMTRSEEVIFS